MYTYVSGQYPVTYHSLTGASYDFLAPIGNCA